LLPLVEVVPSEITDEKILSRCCDYIKNIGMKPLLVRQEIDAHIADRLIEAIWREALWLVHDDIATTSEVDDAMKYAMGLRYALMGVFEHMRLAGGEQGMHHFLKQFGPCLKWPWTKLMDVPDLTDDFVKKIAKQSDEQANGRSIQQLERSRDDTLVGILRALRGTERAAGKTINQHNNNLNKGFNDSDKLYQTVNRQIPQTWTDINGHMNETNYLEVCSQATDKFMEMLGMDADYIKLTDESYFTVETHICHINEAKEGMRISAKTQVLEALGKKLRLFHILETDNGNIVATGEHMLLHVSLKTRSTSLPSKKIALKLEKLFKIHSKLPWPDGAGRSIGNKN
jgi:carnitine 3-dehydrogenase